MAKAYKDGFSKDPAYANPQVRETLDIVLRGYLKDAVTRAYTQRDFSGLRNLSDPRVLQTAWAGVKLMAGWQDGGAPVNIQGAFLETSRSQPSGGRGDLDEDERDAAGELARRMGVDRNVIEKRMIDGKETRRKLGW